MSVFLGLDASTQSLSASVIDTGARRIVAERSVVYGRDLPQYASPHGHLLSTDPKVCHADPRLWAAALDRLLGELSQDGVDLDDIIGISGAAQQHGTVYLERPIDLETESRDLPSHVASRLSRRTAPIWLDGSTTEECEAITAAVGREFIVATTGSRAIERFAASQIKKFARSEPDAYAATSQIHLVSSFMASLLIGGSAPIDVGDGAGMNLLDLSTGSWSAELLDATAPDLGARLPGVVPSSTIMGPIAPYFVRRYGLRPNALVAAFTGDNPSSLVGCGATGHGTTVLSLGTSDTIFRATATPVIDPAGYGHVFGNPAGGFLSLICFANGSLAREAIRDRCGMTWDDFERALSLTEPGNAQNVVLPYFVPEMTPKIARPGVTLHGSATFERGDDRAALARAVVEAQAITMRHHSTWMGDPPTRIRATGGAARNDSILQVVADVFQATVEPLTVGNTAALGAALRAANAIGKVSWEELYGAFVHTDGKRLVRPRQELATRYDALSAAFLERLAERRHSELPGSHRQA